MLFNQKSKKVMIYSLLNFLVCFNFAISAYSGSDHFSDKKCPLVFLQNNEDPKNSPSELDVLFSEFQHNQEIPLEYYEKFDLNQLARAIVGWRMRKEKEYSEQLSSFTGVNFSKDVDIILFFWADDLKSIQEIGFLNQHESRKSRGTFDPNRRMKAEDAFTGLKMGSTADAKVIRPKSAFLNIRGDSFLMAKYHRVLGHFGNIGAVMKSNIRDRSFWSVGDTLGIGEQGPYTDPLDLILKCGSYLRSSIPTDKKVIGYCGGSYEAVIYGRIGLENVDYFLVDDTNSLKLVKSFGRPVYLLQESNENRRVVYRKARMLYEGESIRFPLLAKREYWPKEFELTSKKIAKRMLQLSGIESGLVKQVDRGLYQTRAFELSFIKSKSNSYFALIPNKKENQSQFEDYLSSIRRGSKILSSFEIEHKNKIHLTDQFLLIEGMSPGQELVTNLSPRKRETVFKGLKKLLGKLIKNGIYIRDLNPFLLLMGQSGDLEIIVPIGIRKKTSSEEAARAYSETLLPSWSNYFDGQTIQLFEAWLKNVSVSDNNEDSAA